MARRRVVVTGTGLVSPLGVGVETVWKRLLAGQSGLRRLPEAMVADLGAKIAGTVPDRAMDSEAGFDPDQVIPLKDQKKMDRFIQFAVLAAEEALTQAGWKPETEANRERTATAIASGVGGFPVMMEAAETVRDKGPRRLSPFTVRPSSSISPPGRSRSGTGSRARSARRRPPARQASRPWVTRRA